MSEGAYPKPKSAGFLVLVLMSVVMGSIGAFLTLFLISFNPQWQKTLGIGLSNPSTTTHQEKIVLEESSAVIETVKKISPSVVSILTTRNVRDFFGNVTQEKGGGTGFILTSDGKIITNKHVVSDEQAEYTVVTSDGKDFTAKILAIDPAMDLAILQIDATGLRAVELGNSDDLEPGQWVVAVGNALAEFQNTVTVGVVSATDRQITAGGASGSERLEGLIQTDAAINPGNSGGPLVNLKGQVVGINTAVAGDAQNIGFAIPINIAKTAIDSVNATGRIVRPMLGIRYLPITKEIAQLEKLAVDHGALLVRGSQVGQTAVLPNGPAEKAGLQEGDIITHLNDEEITESRSLAQLLQRYHVGDEVTLKLLRDGKEELVKVTLDELK